MKSLLCSFLLIVFFSVFTRAQDAVCHTRISLLTCAPGKELYSIFGHTALRVTDSAAGTDWVYNYGTFDFDDPDFYMKFVRGKLDYFLSVDQYPDFMYEYQYFERSVWEQVLNLSCNEKQEIITALNINMQGANRMYKYDFIYDNCTTRVRDLIFGSLPGSRVTGSLVPRGTTARNLIHSYLDKGGQPWSKLGIDILLGAGLDKPITDKVAMFLPDYLMKGVDSAVMKTGKPVLQQKRLALTMPSVGEASGMFVPLITFSIVCGLLAAVNFLPSAHARRWSRVLDSLLLYLTGLIGLLLIFMWWGTDHRMTKDNFNLLWALPTNIVAVIFLWRRPSWLRKYFYLAFAETALLIISWFWLPQELNISLAPFILLMLYRYGSLAMKPNVV